MQTKDKWAIGMGVVASWTIMDPLGATGALLVLIILLLFGAVRGLRGTILYCLGAFVGTLIFAIGSLIAHPELWLIE